MRYAPFVQRVAGEGAEAWNIHMAAEARVAKGEDILVLTIGDSDFPTPTSVAEAAKAAIDAGRTKYMAMQGEPALRRIIAARHERLTGVPTRPGQVVVTPGAQTALLGAGLCLYGTGDEVIAPEPMYATYPATLRAGGASLVTVPSPPETGFHPNPDAIAAAVTERTRAIVLTTPNNPTGAVFSREELEAITEICLRHDLWVISDEVYETLCYGRPHVCPASLPGMAERTVVLGSLSKSHAMAGWRLGWTIAPGDLPLHICRFAMCNTFGVPGFVQDAAIEALTSLPDAIPEMHAAYQDRAARLVARLDQVPGLTCRHPEGGMFAMIDIRALGISAYAFAESLLSERNVAVLPADGFGPSAAGHIRVNLGTPDAVFDEALTRIAAHATRAAAAE
jgi:arginine:pyruvate transaminase